MSVQNFEEKEAKFFDQTGICLAMKMRRHRVGKKNLLNTPLQKINTRVVAIGVEHQI